jgi:tellurite resistance protein TerC
MTWFKPIKRVLILLLGGTVLAVGVALIVLPGPAFIVIPAGLAILAIEFAWARRWLQRVREGVRRARRGNAATDVPSPLFEREGKQ